MTRCEYRIPRSKEEAHELMRTRILEIDPAWLEGPRVQLPSIAITVPCRHIDTDETIGRVRRGRYPDGDDPQGERAVRLGAGYYVEGMSLASAGKNDSAIECFRAAEILYRHAAERGHVFGFIDLGYVYSYDRCQGDYIETHMAGAPRDEQGNPVKLTREDVMAKAFACYQVGADAGDLQSCYKLGDLLSRGVGCECDEQKAYEWYLKAWERSNEGRLGEPHEWGSAAIRLASCCEEGRGCACDYSAALKWYELAVAGLQAGVDGGAWFFEKQLVRAKEGLRRMRQELGG